MGLTREQYLNAVDLKRKIGEKFSNEQIRELFVLNLGAGTSGSFVSKHIPEMQFKSLDNVEVFEPYFNVLQSMKFSSRAVFNTHEDIITHMSLNSPHVLDTMTTAASYHLILMIDVLEHLPRTTGEEFIKRLVYTKEKCGAPRTLVFAPIGQCPQDAYDGNEYQRHLSTWELEDFKDFEVEYHPTLHGGYGAAWIWI